MLEDQLHDFGVFDVGNRGDRASAGVLGCGDDDLEGDLGRVGEREERPRHLTDNLARQLQGRCVGNDNVDAAVRGVADVGGQRVRAVGDHDEVNSVVREVLCQWSVDAQDAAHGGGKAVEGLDLVREDAVDAMVQCGLHNCRQQALLDRTDVEPGEVAFAADRCPSLSVPAPVAGRIWSVTIVLSIVGHVPFVG